jgi:hypothetical protein
LRADMRDPVTNRMVDEAGWHETARRAERLQVQINKLKQPAEYEGYRRLAGEVEARNVQTRLDMTPGQRREYAPWETEDVPREDQFVIWHGDNALAIEPLYHGSPHTFDKFEWSPRTYGTGEGAQAYGHGLYFAENQPVAESYITNANWKYNGRDAGEVYNEMAALPWQKQPSNAEMYFWEKVAMGHSPESVRAAAIADADDWPEYAEFARNLDMSGFKREGGNLYEVSVNAEPEDFLDWDAPLSDQPKAMAALNSLDLSVLPEGNRTRVLLERAKAGQEQEHYKATGRDLMNIISNYGEARAKEPEILSPFGLSGVRFLDQGSRGGAGNTRNYVVFDDSLVDMRGRY